MKGFFKPRPSIRRMLKCVLANQEEIMSGIDDLNAAVQGVADAVTAEIAEVQSVITVLQAGGLTDAQAEALAQKLQGTVTTLNTETTTLQGLVPPPA